MVSQSAEQPARPTSVVRADGQPVQLAAVFAQRVAPFGAVQVGQRVFFQQAKRKRAGTRLKPFGVGQEVFAVVYRRKVQGRERAGEGNNPGGFERGMTGKGFHMLPGERKKVFAPGSNGGMPIADEIQKLREREVFSRSQPLLGRENRVFGGKEVLRCAAAIHGRLPEGNLKDFLSCHRFHFPVTAIYFSSSASNSFSALRTGSGDDISMPASFSASMG